ncbi:MAG: hypothetical protein Q4C83_01270 [Candidatus Saccharibacteria bacterium]|nr:hypothetical protein [Candidatus Saccharibacteria bacterium]
MNTGGPKHTNPYAGVGRSLADNLPVRDKVFTSGMPTVQPSDNTVASTQIYGNDYYVNQNLQGVHYSQNIINVDQLANQAAPMTPEMVEQLRRQTINQNAVDYNQYINTPPAYPAQPTNPNQMYMQPPVVPQVSDMSAMNQTSTGYNTTDQPAPPTVPVAPDLTTAEGTIDYLNSISPTNSTTSKMPNLMQSKLFVVIGVAVILIVAALAVIGATGNTGNGFTAKSAAVGEAIANLNEIVEYGEDNQQFTSSDLTGVTAEIHLIMLSHQKQLSDVMTLAMDEDGEATEATADEEIVTELDKAKATGKLSDTYRETLAARLKSLSDTIAEAYSATKKDEIRNKLQSAYTDVNVLLERLDSSISSSGGELTD